MSKNKDKHQQEFDYDEVQKLTDCLFALNRTVNQLKNTLSELNSYSTQQPNSTSQLSSDNIENQLDLEELEKLIPKPTLH